MKAIQGCHLIKPEDLFWQPSNLMKIPNADYLERTGRCVPHGPPCLGARLWRFTRRPKLVHLSAQVYLNKEAESA